MSSLLALLKVAEQVLHLCRERLLPRSLGKIYIPESTESKEFTERVEMVELREFEETLDFALPLRIELMGNDPRDATGDTVDAVDCLDSDAFAKSSNSSNNPSGDGGPEAT